jgi:VWFA-related protein
MILRLSLWQFGAYVICSTAVLCHAQMPTPSPSPTPPPKGEQQETVRVLTEEVRLPIFASDEYGHFDPTLEPDDLLVLEDGVPQQVKSVQRIQASILLLLCASGDVNQAMRTNLTRDIALELVSRLRGGDQIAVVQFTSKVELLQDWTTDKSLITRALGTKDGRPGKLHSGRGTRLAPAVARAAAELQKQPLGNRHVVIIGDGVDTPAWAGYRELMKALDPAGAEAQQASAALAQAIRELIASQAAVHVISYREAQKIHEDQDRKKGGVRSGFGFDPQMQRLRNAYKKAMQRSDERLTSLVKDTGGRLFAPTSEDEMIASGSDVARDIGAQYVITYKPKRPLASAPKDEYRRLTVISRRVGLRVRTRRGYVVSTAP